MNDPTDSRLDQMLVDWAASSRRDASHLAALQKRIIDALREQVKASPASMDTPETLAGIDADRVRGNTSRHQGHTFSWRLVGVYATVSATVLVIVVVFAFWAVKRNGERTVAQQNPALASGNAVSDAVADEPVADADASSDVREASEPGPPPVIEAEIPQAEEYGQSDNPPPSVTADTAEEPSKKMRDGFEEQTDADGIGQRDSFKEVKIESLPKGRGYAHRTLTPDGKVKGGHTSGEPDAVRVFESEESCKAKDLATVRSLVASIRKLHEERVEPDRSAEINRDKHGYLRVTIVFGDGKAATFVVQRDEKFGDADVQAIAEILLRYDAGGW